MVCSLKHVEKHILVYGKDVAFWDGIFAMSTYPMVIHQCRVIVRKVVELKGELFIAIWLVVWNIFYFPIYWE